MSDEFFDRFSNESQPLLLTIFKQFAMRFKNLITFIFADETVSETDKHAVTEPLKARISASIPIAVGDAENFVAQQPTGDYESFKEAMVSASTASLERQYTEILNGQHVPTDEELFDRFGIVPRGGENDEEHIAENTQQ